ncbi:MAG TPA: glycoside hydrolase family 15 protein [Acidobacteriaceae bacterium]|jgi:GH15 family glucan-1,4-alpha-glucosidase|nr:glycoside hydrolase family 15 protein [Acidobacteriaceae bacterium]
MKSLVIEDYALIGDCETAALVGRNGSIDWLCWPDFSSPACFASLLGSTENGRWQIAPEAEPRRITRQYREHTLILETTFATHSGVVTVTDFMPPRGTHSDIVRMVCGVKGKVRMGMHLSLRFDYGNVQPWVELLGKNSYSIAAGPGMAALRSQIPVEWKNGDGYAKFLVNRGDNIFFVLTYGKSFERTPKAIDPVRALKETERFWIAWARKNQYTGPYKEAVERSLITLKAMTYRPSGGIVAAPTTSLPERLGGSLNWDYRYCWLRDATLTIQALTQAGYREEAAAWHQWLLRAIAGDPDKIQIMYGIGGERQLEERVIEWLPGYQRSAPVRIGNAAAKQLQMDIFGELADVLFHARKEGLPTTKGDLQLQEAITTHLAKIWKQPGSGMWEKRGKKHVYTYSRAMAWVTMDRAVRSIEAHGMRGPIRRWRKLRDEIHKDVCRNGFNRQLGSFVQSYGSRRLDASTLRLSLVGFLPESDPRISCTVRAVEKHLLFGGLLQRYKTGAALPKEGTFLACSFWLVQNYARLGRAEDAESLFEKLLTLRNDVGLLAEEYDPQKKRMLGNFPQAFSHIGLVNAAFDLKH